MLVFAVGGSWLPPAMAQAALWRTDYRDSRLLTVERSLPNDRLTSTWTLGANWFLKADDIKLQFNYLITAIDGAPGKSKKLIMRLQTVF